MPKVCCCACSAPRMPLLRRTTWWSAAAAGSASPLLPTNGAAAAPCRRRVLLLCMLCWTTHLLSRRCQRAARLMPRVCPVVCWACRPLLRLNARHQRHLSHMRARLQRSKRGRVGHTGSERGSGSGGRGAVRSRQAGRHPGGGSARHPHLLHQRQQRLDRGACHALPGGELVLLQVARRGAGARVLKGRVGGGGCFCGAGSRWSPHGVGAGWLAGAPSLPPLRHPCCRSDLLQALCHEILKGEAPALLVGQPRRGVLDHLQPGVQGPAGIAAGGGGAGGGWGGVDGDGAARIAVGQLVWGGHTVGQPAARQGETGKRTKPCSLHGRIAAGQAGDGGPLPPQGTAIAAHNLGVPPTHPPEK